MDYQYTKRKTGKDKMRRNREINGKYSAKHIRIQDTCQENHMKNISIREAIKSNAKTKETNKNKNKK
jgi:hypothetical protein